MTIWQGGMLEYFQERKLCVVANVCAIEQVYSCMHSEWFLILCVILHTRVNATKAVSIISPFKRNRQKIDNLNKIKTMYG